MDAPTRGDRVGSAHAWIRNNVLGLVAIFIALSGSAFAAQQASDNNKAQTAKKKAKRGPAGPPGAPGAAGVAGAAGAQGASGLATGPAGGDLFGTYPNPDIGVNKVGSTEIADFSILNTDISNNAVETDVVVNNSLGGSDIANASTADGLRKADITSIDTPVTFTPGAGTINPGDGGCSTLVASVPGAQVGDVVIGTPTTLYSSAAMWPLTVNTPDQVRMVMCNTSAMTQGPPLPTTQWQFALIH